jgi:hypothetical protein
MNIPLDMFFNSFIAGLSSMIGTRGIIFLAVVLGLCFIGVLIRLRFFPYLALLLILLVFILNLHILMVFPPGQGAAALWTWMQYSGGDSLRALYAFIGKIFFNLGVVIVPFFIFLLSSQFSTRPKSPNSEW